MIVIFHKFRKFWQIFWDNIKTAYNKAFKEPIETAVQEWVDISKINFLDIFVGKLNTLTNNQATFEVVSDSKQADKLKDLCKDLEENRYEITENVLGCGDYYAFPATNKKGEIVHSYLTQQQVRILATDGKEIREAYGIIDWLVDNRNRVFYLLRHHKLEDNGTLTVSYASITEEGKPVAVEQWAHLKDKSYSFVNANHIGFGRYKSPASSRGVSPVYGVPLNFGCGEIEARVRNDLKLIEEEFENAKSVIFTDVANVKPVKKKDKDGKDVVVKYKMPKNIVPVNNYPGDKATGIDIFNPTIRESEHYSKLVADMALYEKEVGTSKGILTENETAYTATATAVKRANADTLSLIEKIHTAIDKGNKMTLMADSVFLNIAPDLWTYKSDWYDPFEDPDTQWQRLKEAKENGAAETSDLIKWQFPVLSDEEVLEKLQRIKAETKRDTDEVISGIFSGE